MRKKRPLNDLLLIRAVYIKDVHDAIVNGDKEFVDKYVRDYDGDDKDFYDFEKGYDFDKLQKSLIETDAEIEAAVKSGHRIMGM